MFIKDGMTEIVAQRTINLKAVGAWRLAAGRRPPGADSLNLLAFAKKKSDTTPAPPCDDFRYPAGRFEIDFSAQIVGFRQLEGEQHPGF